MANSFNVPFDFNPTSVSVKTSSYTIPAGSYAYVINASDDDFTINGTAAFENPDSGSTQLASQGTNYDYTVTQSGHFTIALYHAWNSNTTSASVSIAPDGSSFYTLIVSTISSGNETKFENVFLNKGAVIRGSRGSNSSGATRMYYSSCREGIVSGGFWVPTGTQLNGDRYTVALFNEIS
jgi:hypothetical protein